MKQCACGTEIEHHRRVCDDCQDIKKKANNARIKEKRAAGIYLQTRKKPSLDRVTANYDQVAQFTPWERKPKPLILTDEDQRRINAECDTARLARCGMSNFDRGRIIPRDKWPAILPTIRPIHLIRREPLQPLTLNGGI